VAEPITRIAILGGGEEELNVLSEFHRTPGVVIVGIYDRDPRAVALEARPRRRLDLVRLPRRAPGPARAKADSARRAAPPAWSRDSVAPAAGRAALAART